MADFTRNWTDRAVDDWTEHLIPMAGTRERLNLLEIGVFEARSACWLIDNVLTGAEDQYIGMDPWEIAPMNKVRFPRNQVGEDRMRGVEYRARQNLAPYGSKVVLIKGRSNELLRQGVRRDLLYDGAINIAYVDGIHKPLEVLTDSTLVWPLVPPGGVIIWDDYRQTRRRQRHAVGAAVDYFLSTVENRYELLWKRRQLAIRKTA